MEAPGSTSPAHAAVQPREDQPSPTQTLGRLTCCPQNETCTYGSIKTFFSPMILEKPPMMPALMLGSPSARYSLMQTLAQGLSAGTLLGSSRFLKDKFVFWLPPGIQET